MSTNVYVYNHLLILYCPISKTVYLSYINFLSIVENFNICHTKMNILMEKLSEECTKMYEMERETLLFP